MKTYYITIRAWRGDERQMLHTSVKAVSDEGAALYAIQWLDRAYPVRDGWNRRAYTFNGDDWFDV